MWLHRHAKHGYGLDLSDNLVVRSLRSPAMGKVQTGWRVFSVSGRQVATKCDLARALQRLAASTADSPGARFSGEPAAVSFEFSTAGAPAAAAGSSAEEVAVFLKRHEKRGYGLDMSDDLTVTGANLCIRNDEVCTKNDELFCT